MSLISQMAQRGQETHCDLHRQHNGDDVLLRVHLRRITSAMTADHGVYVMLMTGIAQRKLETSSPEEARLQVLAVEVKQSQADGDTERLALLLAEQSELIEKITTLHSKRLISMASALSGGKAGEQATERAAIACA